MKDIVGTKNISRNSESGFRIEKHIKGTHLYYGTYPSLIIALMVRDKLEVENWPRDKVKHSNNPETFIVFKRGKYVINKRINGECKYFGSYNTLQEAHDVKVALSCAGWPYIHRYVKHHLPKYITRDKDGYYRIQKIINKDEKVFGNFRSLQDAIDERNFLIENDWKYDNLDACGTEDDNEIVWLGRRIKI